MKQEERNRITKEKIINAAISEFGTNGYAKTSLTNLCKKHSISKGLIYHYYASKDELYLCCVKECFKSLVVMLKANNHSYESIQDEIHDYFNRREVFFKQYPYFNTIFFDATLQPAKHLIENIKEIRSEFDMLNQMKYHHILEQVELRDSITPEIALRYFIAFQEMLNGYVQSHLKDDVDINTLINDYNLKLTNIMNIILYGLAKQNDNEFFVD